jgi:transcription elongation GreA/GreB family factor
MALSSELAGKSTGEIEEWLLTAIEKVPMPIEEIFDVLESLGSSDRGGQAESLSELFQDALALKEDSASSLRLLNLRCAWSGGTPAFQSLCRKAVKASFMSSRLEKVFVKNVGFEDNLPPQESLRRLGVLSQLAKGTLCHEKTWGFGVVKRVDDFYARVTIDFTGKPAHDMSMAYAGETLELICDDHLLARLHQAPDALQAQLKEDPAEVVRITLRSYGDMSILDIKDRLVDAVMPESAWKSFWDAARKALKQDPLVHIPTRRAESISLLESPDEHLKSQFGELAEQRDPESILAKADALEAGGALKSLTPENGAVLADRLAFAIWGGESKHPDLVARALLMAIRCDVVGEDGALGERKTSVKETVESLLEPDALFAALCKLPVRAMSGLLEHCAVTVPDLLSERLIPLLPKLSISVLTESISRIRQAEHEQDMADSLSGILEARKATPSLLLWAFRNPQTVSGWMRNDPAELLRQGLETIEWPEAGDQLRAQHQLRALFESGTWFADRLSPLSHEQRVVLLAGVQACRGWDEAGRRSVIAGIIKTYPELHEAINSGAPVAVKARARMTSWRSYRERQAQLKKLVEEEIPANSQEIAVARSYGDLRENSEYKYAKEHQRILQRRQDELENDLKSVKGTDFVGSPSDVVGMGTMVTICRPTGNEDGFCILGEWDRDEDLNIISSLSRLAQLLEGHGVGDSVMLPGADGDESCKVTAVEGLNDSVQSWLAS